MFGIKSGLCFFVGLSVLISADEVKNHDWDLLIFTQHWPATVCLEWMEKNPKHTCSFPTQRDAWTVHGVWPTKLGTVGPAFCDHTMKFNQSALDPVEKQLEQYWINVEKDTPLYGLWKHEWEKHGTCAVVLPSLNSEPKYFGQGLQWLQRYSMSDILLQSGVKPNQYVTYQAQDIYNAVKLKIGKNPGVYCREDPKTGKSYIFEIRICFDKSMKLIDCNGIVVSENDRRGKLLHCDVNKPVIYTDFVPSTMSASSPSMEWHIVEMYKLIAWLQWFTL